MIFYCSRCARQVHERRDAEPGARATSLATLPLCPECAPPAARDERPSPEPETPSKRWRRRIFRR